ncbi:MAG: transposase domain-containing protein, partial [Streptosporangiaceae bacterium]
MPDHAAIAGGPAASDPVFPLDLISQVTGRTGPERRRLLPAASVMIFVLGCALFSGEGYAEVVRKVEIWLEGLAGPGGWRIPGTSALARARR